MKVFLTFLSILTLTSATSGDDPKVQAQRIIDYIAQIISTQNHTLFDGLFDKHFVFTSCKAEIFDRDQIIDFLTHVPKSPVVVFTLESAQYIDWNVMFRMSVVGFGRKLNALFIAIPSGKNYSGYLLESGTNTGCPKSRGK